MRFLPLIVLVNLAICPISKAQSNLLETVKRNPKEAYALCKQFRQFNQEGISASSKEAIEIVAEKRKLNKLDAEVLSLYVIGLHCPDVR